MSERQINSNDTRGIDPQIFWPCLLVVLAVTVPSVLNPEGASAVVNTVLAFITGQFGWWFLVFGLGILGFLLWLAFGRYGNIVMGGPGEKPEYSTFSWIAMLFCAGIGISLMYWAIIEPIYYMDGPPFGLEPGSVRATEFAAAYGPYHWGIIPWALYTMGTVPIAYNYYVRKNPRLRMSTASESVLGKYTDKWPGKVIDTFVMFGLIAGVGTSLGLATPMIAAFLSTLFGVPQTMWLNAVIVIVWIALFTTSVVRGLDRGIKTLSNINLYLAFVLAAFILLAGPTGFILNYFVNGLGLQFSNFLEMSLYTDPIAGGGWPQGWTIFFWAWWIAYAPFMALFVARISRGRTIRQIVMGEIVWGSLGCYVYFAILGGYSLHTELTAPVPITELMAEVGGNMAIVEIISSLPLALLVIPVFVVLQFIFAATTLDSGAYVLASVSTRELHANEQPKLWNRLLWSMVLGGTSLVLMLIGGLEPLQTASVVVALPLTLIMIILIAAFMKDIGKDYGDLVAPRSPKPVVYEDGVLVSEAAKSENKAAG